MDFLGEILLQICYRLNCCSLQYTDIDATNTQDQNSLIKFIFSARLSVAFCSKGFGVPPEGLASTEGQTIKLYVTTVL